MGLPFITAISGSIIITSRLHHRQRSRVSRRIVMYVKPAIRRFLDLQACEFTAIRTRERSRSNVLILDVEKRSVSVAT